MMKIKFLILLNINKIDKYLQNYKREVGWEKEQREKEKKKIEIQRENKKVRGNQKIVRIIFIM